MPVVNIDSLDMLRSYVGREIGLGDWFVIEQDRVRLFADATGDDHWFHFPGPRMDASDLGGPLAHGFLVLSLGHIINGYQLTMPKKHGLNYGMDRVRFPHPVHVGDRIRCRSTLLTLDELPGNAVQMKVENVVEIEGRSKPGCVSTNLMRWYLE